MRHIVILWHILCIPILGYSQICGQRDTVLIDRETTTSIEIEINQGDLVNEDLSDPNQGLCAIEIDFRHDYIEGLDLSLVSPSGQVVHLTGPVLTNSLAFSNFARFRISFVASAATAVPDLGFTARWNNNQTNNYVAFGRYTGSYYPFGGDLEDFDTGPTYGTWTLVANNDVSFNLGLLYSVRLIFCDETGLDCCFADAGTLQDTDLLVCEGDASLNYVPDVGYTLPAPDTNLYGYTYVVSRDSVLLGYDSTGVALENFTAGTYQICGLSYLRADSLLLPTPDGIYTLGEMYADLGSLTPTFCAELTVNCQEVIIQVPPLPVDLPVELCEGESYSYQDSIFTGAGSHPYLLQTAAGCDSTVNVIISYIPIERIQLDTAVCAGESVQIGTSSYNATGVFQDTLSSSLGCDSIVTLNLEVLAAITTDLDTVICRGDTLRMGTQAFFNSISTQVVLTSALGCDSTVNLELMVLDPLIVLEPVDTITCSDPMVLLDAGNSAPIGELTFVWQDAGSTLLGTASSLAVDQAGDYLLLVSQEFMGTTCTVSQMITVAANESFPTADAGAPQVLDCATPAITLGGSGTSTGSNFTYAWNTDTGNFLDSTNIPAPRANAPGRYTLIVTNTSSNCRDTASVDITADQDRPIVRLLPDTSLTCNNPTLLLTSDGSSRGSDFVYQWLDESSAVLGSDETLLVDRGGTYRLIIRNATTNCLDSAAVEVVVDTLSPVFSIAQPQALNCENNSIRLDATAIALDPDVSINWLTTNGGVLSADATTLNPEAAAAGTYTLVLNNTRNGCQSSASVQVEDQRNVQTAQPAVPDILSCSVSSVSLDAGSSSSGPNVVYRWSTTNGQFLGAAVGQTVQVNAPGIYTLLVLDTLSRCSATADVEVFRDTNSPVAEAGTGFLINCEVQQDTLFGTGSSGGSEINYHWSGPCLQSNPDSIWVLVDCPGVYYLEVTNTSNNCVVIDSVAVILDQQVPVAAVAPVDTLDCTTTEVLLDAGPSTPAADLIYSWTGPGLSGSVALPSITVGEPGEYRLIITDTLRLCQDTLLVTVPVDTLRPIADAGPEVQLTCAEPQAEIGSLNTGQGAFFRYNWLAIEGQLDGVTDSAFTTVDQEGIYRLIVTDTRNSCRDSSTVVVVQDQELPGAHAGFDQEINCGTDLIVLDGSNSVQQAGISYTWSGPCLLGRTDSIFAQANCPGDYFLTVTNGLTGCSAVDTVTITLNPAAPRAVLPDTAVIDCATGMVALDGTASSNGFFEWTHNGVLIFSGLESINVDEIGTYVLSVSNQDKSCIATDSIVVVSDCRPQAAIAPPDRITCQSPAVILDAGASSGQALTYEWIAADASCIVAGQGTAQLEVSCAGTYTLIVSNSTVALSDTQSVLVEMDANIPRAVVGPADTLTCVQNEVLLDGSASSTGQNIVYTWTRVSNGAVIARTPTAVTIEPGTFVLEVTDTSSLCSSTATVRIVQFNLPLSISFGDSLIPCGQDTFALRAFPSPLSDFYTYQWSGPEVLAQADSAVVMLGAVGTYSLTLTDTRSECQTEASVTVNADLQCAPCIQIAPPDTLTCTQNSLQLQASFCLPCTGCVLQWTTADGRILADGNTLGPTVDQPGTYRLTVIDLQGFQTDVEIEVAADNSLPIAEAGPDRFLTCGTDSALLGEANAAAPPSWVYRWTRLEDPAQVLAAQPELTVAETGTYQLLLRDTLTGCSTLDTALVQYDTLVPVANAGPDRQLSCTETFVILDGSGSTAGNDIVYTWTTAAANSCLQGSNAINPIAECTGTYYLRVENRTSACFAIDSMVVANAADVPLLSPLPDTTLSCTSDSISLVATLPANGNYSFGWCALDQNGMELPQTCNTDTVLTVSLPGSYRFSARDLATGCAASFTVAVDDRRELPDVDAGPDQVFRCIDDRLELQGVIGPDPRLLDYQWISLGNLPIGDANTLSPIVYEADTIILLVTNRQTNCAVQDTVIIRQDNNAPLVNAGVDTVLNCLQTTLRLQGAAQSTSGSGLSYRWSTNDGNIQANGNTLTPLVNRPGIYVLVVTDNQNSCAAADTLVVTDESQKPVAAIAGLDSLQFNCDMNSLLLDAAPSSAGAGGALDYFWAVVSTGQLDGDVNSSSINATSIGTYRLIVSDPQSGCRDSLQFTLNAAFGAPVIRIANPAILTCTRTETVLDATASEFGPAYSASWYNEQGDLLQTDNLILTVSQAGSYTLQIDNNDSGCSNVSTPVQVTVDTVAPVVSIATPGLLDCSISTVRLEGSTASAGSGFTYQWSSADGILLGPDNQLVTTAGGPGLYQLQVTNNRNGCTAGETIQVEAISTSITGLVVEVAAPSCDNEAGGSILVSDVSGGTPPYTYSLNGGLDLSSPSFGQLRTGPYRLTVRDANGCEWEEDVFVPGIIPINLDLGPDLLLQIGDSIELLAQTSTTAVVSYQWEPQIGTGPNPVVAPTVSTSYSLTVTDVNGCTATDRVLVRVQKERAYFLPTAFSPDGDGNNDRFMVLTGQDVINIPSFRIYDRWGHLVYERANIPPNDPDLGWDGRHNGLLMNPAVFVYFVELEFNDGWVESVKGDVTLLR